MNNIMVNELLQVLDGVDSCKKIERVLWIDDKYNFCFTIDIFSSKSIPKIRKIRDIEQAIEDENIIAGVKNDPGFKVVDEDKVSEKYKELRGKAWEIVNFIANEENEPDIFYPHDRKSMIDSAIQKFGGSYRTIYKYLRRYWQGGKHKNTLLPQYFMSGAPGVEKKSADLKRGRPCSIFPIGNPSQGINVDDNIKVIFKKAIRRFYDTPKEIPLSKVYKLMLGEYFSKEFMVNGLKQKEVLPASQIPTLGQFRYWFNKEKDLQRHLIKRKGQKRWELEYRPILSNCVSEAWGPGSRFQIDATISNVYLVSRFNRDWIVGKPTVYSVIDVFSTLVVGIYVGFRKPSWEGAAMALLNTIEDKVSYCARYNIRIDKSQWPCEGLPAAILADRGEFEGSMPDGLIQFLKVDVENTSPYRGDLKPIIEKFHDEIDQSIKHQTPGVIKSEFRERGETDYRLDAKLDIDQFTRMLIQLVLFHNNSKWLDNYSRDEFMVNDEVNLFPVALWVWGIKNRSGKLRKVPEDIAKLHFMHKGEAGVLREGIKFMNIFYACKKAMKENWFSIAEIKGSWKVDIRYDPRDMTHIYIPHEDGKGFEKCFILEKNDRYMYKSLDEVRNLQQQEKNIKRSNIDYINQSEVTLNQRLKEIVKEAVEMHDGSCNSQSKAKRLNDIRLNNKIERTAISKDEAFNIGDEIVCSLNPVHNTKDINSVESLEDNTDLEILMKVRRKMSHDGNTGTDEL